MNNSTLLCLRMLSAGVLIVFSASAQSTNFNGFAPNNLVVSRSVYTGTASTVMVGQALPPNCPSTAACGKAVATDDGRFPSTAYANNVWNNDTVDGSFGVTSPVFLDQLMASNGMVISTLAVPTSTVNTSFSSKSELGLNLSTDGTAITFMAYAAPANTLDVSNSNTPLVYDPTNPVGASFSRDVIQVDAKGNFQFTPTSAYSGNNGRAAILAGGSYYMVGNDNNGSGTPTNIVMSTGVEISTPGQPASTVPQQVGNFSVSQYNNPSTGVPWPADKAGKDNNFRGLTIFNNTLYVTKGSGSNGINTVYQVGAAGTLPTLANASTTPITVLPGFNTQSEKAGASGLYPFGIWFANANMLYVADEGDGTAATAATNPNSGLQKWTLNNGVWKRVYVLQNGLQLGVQYGTTGYPTKLNPVTGGLRNITGRINGDGTATIWAITSTVSANGDQGADPNRLVVINDIVANTDPGVAGGEQFQLLKSAGYGEVLRGVTLTPGTVAIAPPALTVVSSASAVPGAIAPGSLATVYGSAIANVSAAMTAFEVLPTVIGGASVSITDSTGASFQTSMLSANASQAVFVVPSNVATGSATVTVQTGGGKTMTATVTVNKTAPALFTLNSSGLAAADVVTSQNNGTQGPVPSVYGLNSEGAISANAIDVSSGNVSVALFGTGIRGGAPATVTVNGTAVTVNYSGPQVQFPGLDEVNIALPSSLAGSGWVPVQVASGGLTSNTVNLLIK